MSLTFKQRGRSSLEFLGALQRYTGGRLQQRAKEYFDSHVDPALAEARLDDRLDADAAVMEGSKDYQFNRFYTRFVAEELYRQGLPATEAIRDQIETALAATGDAGGTLELNPNVKIPAYYDGYGFHLTPGGWDGHELVAFTMHDGIYPYVFKVGGVGAVATGENVIDQRVMVAREARKKSYRRILEPGCGTGRYAAALQQVFPDAQIVGIDLSAVMLRYAHHYAAELGYRWELRQAAAEDTGYPDASFDLVSVYTLLHEVPPRPTADFAREMFRVLEPGGEIVIGDVPPYTHQERFQALILDWETHNRNEPFWRAAGKLDRVSLLRESGFVDVEAYGLGPGNYPWVVRGRKP